MWVFLVNLIFFPYPCRKNKGNLKNTSETNTSLPKLISGHFWKRPNSSRTGTCSQVFHWQLCLLACTLMARAYCSLTHMLTLWVVGQKTPALRKGRHRLYHSTFLILFCFFKERAQMSILILCYLHPVFKYTFIFASLLLFTFLRTLNSLRIIIHEETWNESFPMNYLCLLWGLLSVVRLSMPEIILLRQKNHFFPSWEISLLDTFIF